MKAMRAIVLQGVGSPDVLTLGEREMPAPQSEELLVKVHATAINRADLLQRTGKYAPPSGASDILGLEIAGEVVACGSHVENFNVGDFIFGLVSGGGYAEYCVIDQGLAIKMPKNWKITDAAGIIETFVTANETIVELGGAQKDKSIMIHAGGSGVGTAGIQMAHYLGATIFTTTSSEDKIHKILALGANEAINYKLADFEKVVLEKTQGQGVNIVEDFIGAGYFEKNLSILKSGGCLVQVGLMRGTRVELDLRYLMDKHLQIKGFILRKRTLAEKRAMVARFAQRWMPVLEKGLIKPIIDSVFPMSMVKDAHRYVEDNNNFGKVILSWE